MIEPDIPGNSSWMPKVLYAGLRSRLERLGWLWNELGEFAGDWIAG